MRPEAITVIIPNYNKAAYITDTIESLLRQEETHWRAIIMDDGSTDASRSLLASYAPLLDPRFTVHVHDGHRGKAACMNQLVALATTDIIGELDSDDALVERCLGDVLDAYERSDSGFVYTNFTYCTPDLVPRQTGYCAPIPDGRTALEVDCVSAFRTFRKSAFVKTAGFDESLESAIDKDLIYKLEEVTKPYFVDRELYRYRMLPVSLSRGPDTSDVARNHQLAKARALARRGGDPRAVR
jgi:glycosyltransferase involved in cell wall biosynthesis